MRLTSRPVLAGAALLGLLVPSGAHAGPATPAAVALARRTAERVGTTLAPDDAPLSSDNVELVTTIPGSAAGMRIVGRHAYVTGWAGLTVLDVSAPAAPKVVSTLPLAHFENEDVDSDGKVVLVANDREKNSLGGVLYVVDVTKPASPAVASVLPLTQVTSDERGPGHIANCVKDGCRWVWLTGGTRVWVVDLRDPRTPLLAGVFSTPVGGVTHDVERDAAGRLWVSAQNGVAVYDGRDPLHPKLLATTGARGRAPEVNDFILHNAHRPSAKAYRPHRGGGLAPGDVLLVTEEDYLDTDESQPGSCHGQGKFQTWDVRGHERGRSPALLGQWRTELGEVPALAGSKAPVTAFCSSHWFTERRGIVADAWYEQGVRLLDTRDPRRVRQIGYWLPPNAETWAAYWVTDEIVYTADTARGIDVIRVHGATRSAASPTVVAPIRASWLGAGPRRLAFRPSADWGTACLVPVA